MKYNCLKSSVTFATLLFICPYLFSQDCTVEKESLRGTYTGDCKKGKASGHGKAIGADTYDGEFDAGWPDGEGTYTWSNGNNYKGNFKKGLKNGDGVMTYKRSDRTDSVVAGFWKRDVYVGRNEKPYKINYRSRKVTEVSIQYKKSTVKLVTFWVSSTSGGAKTISQGIIEKMIVNDIQLLSGSYTMVTRRDDNNSHKTETILHDVLYPIKMKVNMRSESVEIELLEEGSYMIDIHVNGD